MTNKTRLIVVEDNPERKSELAAILSVAGVECTVVGSSDWKGELGVNEVSNSVLLGEVENSKLIEKILRDCHNEQHSIPIVSFGNKQHFNQNNLDGCDMVAHLDWPFSLDELSNVLYSCQAYSQSSLNNQEKSKANALRAKMVGNGQAIEDVRKLIQQVANSEASVLILGESGTGKEVAARNLHDLSDRRDKPFVPINCGAIPAELLESELFGHEKGAFTGALTARKGRFELAEGGTIFLDEIGDMPMPMQVKLLRVLQEKTFEKVGSSNSIVANVRIIAATHRKLADEVKENRFREDLFYRLNVFPIDMPPLRDRVEDIPQLVSVLVARLEKDKRGSVRLSPNAIESLQQCQWPGNVRELANLIERLCILHPYGVVDVRELPLDYQSSELQNSFQSPNVPTQQSPVDNSMNLTNLSDTEIPSDGIDLKDHIKNLEIAYIKKALDEESWVVARAAKRLKMQRTTLVEKMRKYNLQKGD